MLKDLPLSLLDAVQKVVENSAPLDSCTDCGMVKGSCIHTEGQSVFEDAITKMNIPTEDEPEEQLTGEKEQVIINPEYKTFKRRMPY